MPETVRKRARVPDHKTKIVCTIGPASESTPVLERLLQAGMNVARLNFSHGELTAHARVIENLRVASRASRRRVAIMADLSGPKLRIGEFANDAVELVAGETFTLTTEEVVGGPGRVSVTFPRLTDVVRPGHSLSLNDGLIQLDVQAIEGTDVRCRVVVGGELRARKGLNLPGIDLGMSAFTERDRECLAFALSHGIDAVSQSFVSTADDVLAVREAAAELGHRPFVIAKIERAAALEHIDAILQAADGIMVARGDLGVEMPIEGIAMVQKRLIHKANRLGKPVITATHMLESMVEHRRPTRAEATDVANAILDGTDCVMLSGESAMGRFPVESTLMLAKIAATTEPCRPPVRLREAVEARGGDGDVSIRDLIALNVHNTLERVRPVAVIVPTRSGATARSIARFRLPVWISAFSDSEASCQSLQFSYGVNAELVAEDLPEWTDFACQWLQSQGFPEGLAVLTQGPSRSGATGTHRLEILELGRNGTDAEEPADRRR